MLPTRITVGDLIERGPGYVRDFICRPHDDNEFAPEFSWLLLAEAVGIRVSLNRTSNPSLAARWAEIAAILYEGLIRGSRPQDDLARTLWAKTAVHYRALAAGSPPPVGAAPDSREPHPL
jgi:hypothetical protein